MIFGSLHLHHRNQDSKMSATLHKTYIRYSWFLVGMVFLVILAGGIVRMTQSGMGCPDWPRCFGMWIPPTDVSELPADFEKYLRKQDIDHSFNVYHTWIEYVNRLLGALLGVFILIYTFWTALKFSQRRGRMRNLLLSVFGMIGCCIIFGLLGSKLFLGICGFLLLAVLVYAIYFAVRYSGRRDLMLIGFGLLVAVMIQGWLGKVVVDENLSVVKITVHMVGALVIAALPLWSIACLEATKIEVPRRYALALSVLSGIILVQIIFGTQVREDIDTISKSLSYEQREIWIERLGVIFVVHRSFSWVIVLLTGLLLYWSRGLSSVKNGTLLTGSLVCVIIILGVVMAYLDMPALAQPLHLFFACGLLMQIFYLRMRVVSK